MIVLAATPEHRQFPTSEGRDRQPGPALSHIDVGVRDLRNDTARVIDALRTGQRVTLTVRGEPIADIVPHGSRTRWLSGASLGEQLVRRSADPGQRVGDDSLGEACD